MRSLVAFVAGVAACLLLPLAIASAWTDTTVNSTEAYVDAVGPLADDARVQEAVAERLADIAVGRLGAAAPRAVIEQAALRVVETDTFARTWRAANRAAHPQLVAALDDDDGVRDDGRVTLDLAALAESTLREIGAPVALDLGAEDLTFTIARNEDLREARVAYALLDPAGFWLPVACLVGVGVALAAARDRRGALTWLSIGSAVALALFWLVIGIGRAVFADSLPGVDRDLGAAVYDVLTDSLITQLVIALAVSVGLAICFAVAGLWGRRTTRP